jgi:TPR repeat protein
MKATIVLTTGVFLIGMVGSATADPLADAGAAYDKGDYATALQDLRPLAARGVAAAQDDLGLMYHNGQGVAQDYAQSFSWYQKAATQGDSDGQYRVGLSYYAGWGVPKNGANAFAWFSKSANQRNPMAQSMVGVCYDQGFGVRQDYVAAYMWLTLAIAGLANSDPQMAQNDVQSRTNVASHMTPAQIAQAQTMANQWKPK